MSRKRKNTKQKSPSGNKNISDDAYKKRKFKRDIRRAIVGGLILVSLVGGGMLWVDRYKATMADERDLSNIGNGVAAIVQVHDPDCPLCQKLMKNTRAALRGYDDEVQFRIADLSTGAGRKFQRNHHNVPNVTLVFFDGSGKFRWVLSGVSEVEKIEQEIERLLNRS